MELLRSLQQLIRARRRSTRSRQDAATVMMLSALEGSEGQRISALAELLLIDLSAASRQVSALESAGFLTRVKDDADHRAQLIRLTPAGKQALAQARERTGSDVAQRISHWTSDEIRLLTGLLERLAGDLVASEPGCTKTPPEHPQH